jgi:signal transduction histidine kinase
VSQIIMNLVTNGCKFARGSEVRVSVRVEQADEGTAAAAAAASAHSQQPEAVAPSWLRVEVADAGAGLTAEACERVFRPFKRAPPEQGGGTGLGLHLCRAFARALGGDVSVESTPAVGSRCGAGVLCLALRV